MIIWLKLVIVKIGRQIQCPFQNNSRYQILLPSGRFISETVQAPVNQWLHIVFNFIGSKNGQGFKAYHDGALVLNDTSKDKDRWLPADKNIVIGRLYTEQGGGYSSVQVDEVLLYNYALTEKQIDRLNL